MNKIAIGIIVMLISFTACKKDTESNTPNTSRVIRYEVTGSFAGTLFASYTTASGGTNNEQITSIPWSKEITYASNVTAAIIAISGNGGTAGQQVTILVKKGGSQFSITPATADGSGSFSKSAPVITF